MRGTRRLSGVPSKPGGVKSVTTISYSPAVRPRTVPPRTVAAVRGATVRTWASATTCPWASRGAHLERDFRARHDDDRGR